MCGSNNVYMCTLSLRENVENEAVVILFQYNLMIYGADQIVGLNPVDGFKTTCLRHTSIVEHVVPCVVAWSCLTGWCFR